MAVAHLLLLHRHVCTHTDNVGCFARAISTAKKPEGNNHIVFWWSISQITHALNNIPLYLIIQTRISLSAWIHNYLKTLFGKKRDINFNWKRVQVISELHFRY